VDAGRLKYNSSNYDVSCVIFGALVALGEGEADITVSFDGDDKYEAAESKIIHVKVTLNDASVSVENDTLDLFVGDFDFINATTVPEGLTINYTSSNESVVTVDSDGFVQAMGEGSANITVKVGGDGIYAENSTTVTVNVSKIPTEILIANETLDLKVLENHTTGATLIPDAGNLTYTSSNSSVAVVEDDMIRAVGEGSTVITVSFAGDDKYDAASNKTITVTVRLNDASVSVNNSTLDLLIEDTFTLVATTVPDGLKVRYTTDDESIISVDDNGKITALSEGNATITVIVGDNQIYKYDSVIVNVTVSKIDPSSDMEIEIGEITYGQDAVIEVKLPGDAEGNITVKVDGNEAATIPVKDGNANLTIPGLSAGNHTIEVAYSGDDKYTPSQKSATLTVDKKPTAINATDVTTRYNVAKDLVITLTDAHNNPIGGAEIAVDLNGAENYTTDDNGQVKIPITDLAAGNYTATIKFTGNDNCTGSDASVNVVVKKAKSKIKAKKKTYKTTTKTKKFKIKLRDKNKNPIANAKVKLKVNGKKYKAKTNSKGKAVFKIKKLNKKGKYKVAIKFKGNENYTKAVKKTKIKVKSAFQP
jgi:uncharacterized protein YjdB